MKIADLSPEDRLKIEGLAKELSRHRATTFQMVLNMEMAKLDTSGVSYRHVREYLPVYMEWYDPCPPVLMFIVNEMSRERPFYPDKGRLVTDTVMERSMKVGFLIRDIKEEHPDRPIDDIIFQLAEHMGKSVGTIKQDYEQRYLPIFKKAYAITSSLPEFLEEYCLDSAEPFTRSVQTRLSLT